MSKRRINPQDIQFEIDRQEHCVMVRASITVAQTAEIGKEVDFAQIEETTRQNLIRAVMNLIYGDMWILAQKIGVEVFELAPDNNQEPYRPILDLLDKINKIGAHNEDAD